MAKRKIVLVDILDDPPFDITKIFRDACAKGGIPRTVIKGLNGLRNLGRMIREDVHLAGIIISGSKHNLSDGITNWMAELSSVIRWYHGHCPILGVCFGHQIIAHAFGGRVERHPTLKEIGSVEIQLTNSAKEDVLFKDLRKVARVQMTHGDLVTSLPPGAILLAYNDYAPVQAFRLGETWGIQFHPELTPQIFEKLLSGRIRLLRTDEKHEDARHYQDTLEQVVDCPDGREVLVRFIKYCLKKEE